MHIHWNAFYLDNTPLTTTIRKYIVFSLFQKVFLIFYSSQSPFLIGNHCYFFFFLIFYLLLFWLLWVFFAAHGFSSSCSAGASHCGGFSFCKAQTVGLRPLVVAAHGVTSYGSQALELWLSSCGEPRSPSLTVEFLTTLPPGMSGTTVLIFIMVN